MFPENIKIWIKLKNSSIPVAKCAVRITIFAHHKNHYYMTLLTNSSGLAELNREEIEREIDHSITHFPMDYLSDLSDCDHVVRIDVLSGDDIRSNLEGIEIWASVFSETQELMNKLRTAENEKYKPCSTMLNVEERAEVELEVQYVNDSNCILHSSD